jgi:hypothetical protein
MIPFQLLDKRAPSLLLITATLVVGIGLASTPAGGQDKQTKLAPVGLQKQLFVDDFIIAEMRHVKRQLGTVHKANYGQPILSDCRLYGTVLYDEGRFKLWFRKPGSEGYGYAESRDGLKFDKLADVRGINFAGDYTLAVEIDPHETDAKHRYKAGYDAPGMAAGVAHSADGITWMPYNDGKPVTGRAADTYNQILWDPIAKNYRLFTRTDFGDAGGPGEIRGTRSLVNPDVKDNPTDWRTVREWMFDKEGRQESKRRQVYAVACWIYEGVYFALLTVYDHPADMSEGLTTDLNKRHERDVLNFYIATSRDGDSWDLQWVYAGQPMIPRGGDGAFDKDLLIPASTVVTHDDRHWLYYSGADERHGTPDVVFNRTLKIGLATLRLDGFVGLVAGDEQATVATRPFRLEGTGLEVNVDATEGTAAVEILDEQGMPVPGYSGDAAISLANADELRWQPEWKEKRDLAALRGNVVRLRFLLRQAKLYSFRVTEMPRAPQPKAPG